MRTQTFVLVAGMPRSGSTWVFNAARLALKMGGRTVYSAWIDDYESDARADVHLVKTHLPGHVPFEPDIVLTSCRPYAECLSSLIRMGWLTPDPQAILARYAQQRELYEYWAARSNLEVNYTTILADPQAAVAAVSRTIGLDNNDATHAAIARELAAMQTPMTGAPYDAETLLHPNHRSPSPSRDIPNALVDQVEAILRGAS